MCREPSLGVTTGWLEIHAPGGGRDVCVSTNVCRHERVMDAGWMCAILQRRVDTYQCRAPQKGLHSRTRAGIPARGRLSREALVKRMNKRADVLGGFRWKRTGAWRGWVGLRLVKRDDEEARPLPRDGARLASATRRERS